MCCVVLLEKNYHGIYRYNLTVCYQIVKCPPLCSSTAHTKCRRKSGPRSCTEVHRQYHNRSMVVVVRPTSRSEAATRRQRAHPPAGRERPPAGTRRVRAVAASDLVSTSVAGGISMSDIADDSRPMSSSSTRRMSPVAALWSLSSPPSLRCAGSGDALSTGVGSF